MNKKSLQATIEAAMRQGLTLDEVMDAAQHASDDIIEEQIREDRVAQARLKAAEAMAEYITLVTGEKQEIEDMYATLEETEALVPMVFTSHDCDCGPDCDCDCECHDEEPKVKVTVIDGSDAEDAFMQLIEKLGL